MGEMRAVCVCGGGGGGGGGGRGLARPLHMTVYTETHNNLSYMLVWFRTFSYGA